MHVSVALEEVDAGRDSVILNEPSSLVSKAFLEVIPSKLSSDELSAFRASGAFLAGITKRGMSVDIL